VTAVTQETPSVRTIELALPDWPGHQAGQHLDIRLTAEDGYTGDGDGDGLSVGYTLTRAQPSGWTGYAGRVNAALLSEVAWPADKEPLAFVCGPTTFVENVAGELVGLGYPPGRVKTERFGGTGGP
jgi:ferredoxin-NADP reductase